MVTVDCLAGLDHLIWLRTGSRAAEALQCNQSTISRQAKLAQEAFNISISKSSAEWEVKGDDQLLNAERRVHQLYRWSKNKPLRLDAQHWLRDNYFPSPLQGWTAGNLNYFEYRRPEYLLKHCIIDAWLCSAPDVSNDPGLAATQLCSMPVYLVSHRSHPLATQGAPLDVNDIRNYPLLPLPRDEFPAFQSMLKSIGLYPDGNPDTSLTNNEQEQIDLQPENLLIGLATPLTLDLYGSDWEILPFDLPITVGDALVVRSEFVDHPRTKVLLRQLLDRLNHRASNLKDVKIFDTARSVC